jgi:chromate transporter
VIYLKLFLTFLKIGAVSFGGGYGMISLIKDDCLSYGWLTEEELLNFIAVAESTPGPIAVNMATFIGSSQGGALGALMATLGVVLPSFVIILLIASLFTRILSCTGVKAALGGIRPAIIAMILGTAATLFLSTVLGIKSLNGTGAALLDVRPLAVISIVCVASLLYKKIKKTACSPILLIIISGLLGILIYGV